MAEEIEVNVRQIDEENGSSATPMNEILRRLMLAGIGAVALTRDEVESFINRLVERGELAQKDGEKLMNEVKERFRQQRPQAEAVEAEAQTQVNNIGEQLENSLEQFLNRLNVPSKRDIDELSAKIAQLAARVEELRRTQSPEQGAAPEQGTPPA
ncbi:MAG: phasin family protein [Chloroflexaceae bacterium]